MAGGRRHGEELRRRSGRLPLACKETAPLRKKAKDAETKIAKLAEERAKIEAKLADPKLYAAGKVADITAAQTRLAAIARETEAAELDWLEAHEALEAATAA